jgi:putative transposase
MSYGKELNHFFQRGRFLGGIGARNESQAVDGPRYQTGKYLRALSIYSGLGANGKPFLSSSGAEAPFTCAFNNGNKQVFGAGCGKKDWPNIMKWKAFNGGGRLLMGPWANHLLEGKRLDQTPQIGEKKGVKRHVLTDGRGVPLSLAVTGANVHDQKGLKVLLGGIPIRRPRPRKYKPQTLCLDKGYDSPACRKELLKRGYRDGTKSRGTEKQEKRLNPLKRARRWVVERTHSWMTNWRKVLVRYEKKACNYLAMLQIIAAICGFRACNVLG